MGTGFDAAKRSKFMSKWNKLPVDKDIAKTHRHVWVHSTVRGVRLTLAGHAGDMPDDVAWMLGPEQPEISMTGWRRPEELPSQSGDYAVITQTESQRMTGRTGWPFVTYYHAPKESFNGCGAEGPVLWQPIPKPPKGARA